LVVLLNNFKVINFELIFRLLVLTDSFKEEDVASYNIYYNRLVKWMRETLRLRKLDIESRRTKKRENHELRE
jgi:hypothetical protein